MPKYKEIAIALKKNHRRRVQGRRTVTRSRNSRKNLQYESSNSEKSYSIAN